MILPPAKLFWGADFYCFSLHDFCKAAMLRWFLWQGINFPEISRVNRRMDEPGLG